MSPDEAQGEAARKPQQRAPLSDDDLAEHLQELVSRHAAMLAEHFSSVQIICTNLECDGRTRTFSYGHGDYYARKGAAKDWLDKERPKRS